VLNENNWFPAMTLIVGNPDETDEDNMATLDLIYEMERRGLFAFLIPSIFTPLHDTRMEMEKGVTQTKQLTPLQWQLMMSKIYIGKPLKTLTRAELLKTIRPAQWKYLRHDCGDVPVEVAAVAA
jgi:radical SAM superfamily enzyme YgiQ (UPF0313 family)